MTIYLVRHDRVTITDRCYGQSDVRTCRTFSESARLIIEQLPEQPSTVFTSPLSRCAKLAGQCYPKQPIIKESRLMEVDFGSWENQPWDSIPRTALDQWAKTPTCYQFPEGEHLETFQHRVMQFATEHIQTTSSAVVFTHAGVIRRLCAWYGQQQWANWLTYPLPYLSITRLSHGQIEQSSCAEI